MSSLVVAALRDLLVYLLGQLWISRQLIIDCPRVQLLLFTDRTGQSCSDT